MTNYTSAIYTENEVELSWPIEPSVIYDKKKK